MTENHFENLMQGNVLDETTLEQLKLQSERERQIGWKTELIQGITTIISVSNGYKIYYELKLTILTLRSANLKSGETLQYEL